jgi:predicted metal-dependent phosphoesterase TrpH
MDLSDGIADLHMHTTASDGTCSVSDRISQAREQNLETIAITDHDSISEDIEHRVTSLEAVELIAGVEIRADVQNTKVELLGYFVDPNDTQLEDVLEKVRSYRRDRNRKMIDRLHELTTFDRSYEELQAEADGVLGRPHVADALISENVVDTIDAAFTKYLAGSGAAFVPMDRIPASEVIDVIHGAGGVVSLAHPGRVRTDDLQTILNELVTSGLDGIEVQYPYDDSPSGEYADVSVEDAATIAEERNLIKTGGSDCHGPRSGKFRIGDVRVTEKQLDALYNRASQYRSVQ